jgi:hypothetical protein
VLIRIRSGGHHYEGYSNGDCTLVIDISEMNAMEINVTTSISRIMSFPAIRRNTTGHILVYFAGSKGFMTP